MRYSEPTKVSLLSLTLLISFAGILEVFDPYSSQAAERTLELLTAQSVSSPTSFPAIQNLPPGTQVKIDSSATMKAINQVLQQRFPQKYLGTELLVSYSGSEAALQALQAGKVDLAAIGRALTEAEQSQGLTSLPLTRHKIALIVGADNPFAGGLTDAQFAKIFRGEITNWSELGGVDRPLRFIDRPSSSETRQALQNYPVFRAAPFQSGTKSKQMTTEEPEPLVKELGNDSLSYAIADQVVNKPGVRVLTMYNTLPIDPRYPFSQPLSYVYKSANPTPGIQAFLGYITAIENQPAIEAARVAGVTTAVATLAPSPAASSSSPSLTSTDKSGNSKSAGGVPSPTSISSGAIASPNLAGSSPGIVANTNPLTSGGTGSGIADTNTGVSGTTGQGNKEGAEGNLWWLLLLCLGLPFLLAWLIWKVGQKKKPSILVLTPEPGQSARAYWELDPEKIQNLRKQGEKNLTIRLTDVTNINPQVTNPALIAQIECSMGESLISFPIPEVDREYQAELGYVTTVGNWVSLAKSASTYFSAPRDFLGGLGGAGIVTAIGSNAIGSIDNQGSSSGVSAPVPTPATTPIPTQDTIQTKLEVAEDTGGTIAPPTPPIVQSPTVTTPQSVPLNTAPPDSLNISLNEGVAGGIIGGVAAAAVVSQQEGSIAESGIKRTGKTQIHLDKHALQEGYAYWDIAPEDHLFLESKGEGDMILRIHDATDIDIDFRPPHGTQEYVCDLEQYDRYVPIIIGDRPYADYIAELGYLTPTGIWLRVIRSLHTRFSWD